MSDGSFSVKRRLVLAGLLASAAGTAFADPLARSIRPKPRPVTFPAEAAGADALISRARLGGRVTYAVADAVTGEMLEVKSPLLPMPPASTAKAITSLYALDALGADFRFRTQVVATGPLENGRVKGDLVLVGGGDPTLNTDRLGDLAAALKEAGVREVTGRFLYFARALPRLRAIDPEQPEHVGYNPAISGLNLNFNRVHFEWRRATKGWDIVMDARALRYRPRVSVARMDVVERRFPVYTYSDGGAVDEWTVASGALGREGSRWLPVRKPGAYAAEVFQTLARSHGIVLPMPHEARQSPAGTVVCDQVSDPLLTILQGMMKYSTNVTAELVGLTASRAAGGSPASLKGSAAQMSRWLKQEYGARRTTFVDHSGLGPGSRVAANDMVRALVQVGPDGPLKPLMKDIAMRDAGGRPVKDHPVTVRAKTGTLNFVSALVGYASLPSGRELAFAIFTADADKRAKLSPAERERPKGGRAWAGRSRTLQMRLIDRWAKLYAS